MSARADDQEQAENRAHAVPGDERGGPRKRENQREADEIDGVNGAAPRAEHAPKLVNLPVDHAVNPGVAERVAKNEAVE